MTQSDLDKIEVAVTEWRRQLLRAAEENFNGTLGIRITRSRNRGQFGGIRVIRETEHG